ncbi:hypothetical protein [Arthrobacter sp. SX1312]|uniref:hypothetical protein n=1 Tax=Arthrobacter sp. SX1312 TaxID=2058896 RepID=UPI000CE50DFE|nr:hypothetical protein [Arthrobacter sp. SX1312]
MTTETKTSSRPPEKTAWWAVCDGCECVTVVVRHPDTKADTPEPEVWDTPGSCPVCGAFIANQWNSDAASAVRL